MYFISNTANCFTSTAYCTILLLKRDLRLHLLNVNEHSFDENVIEKLGVTIFKKVTDNKIIKI